MRKKSICLLLITCLGTALWAQNNQDYIPKLIPPSPNAAAMEKFSTIPVDYSTGVPSISYPMWSWQHGKLQFSIGLSYHAGGHKIDDMPSNTGLGWSLSGIGRVSRTVRGLPDDKPIKGFINSDPLPNASTSSYDGTQYYYTSSSIYTQTNYPSNIAITQYNTAYSQTIRDIVRSQLDGEQDIFSYSINGKSGRFVLDKDGDVVPLEQTKVKIEPVYSSSMGSKQIVSFKITDDNGILYRFEYQEGQYATTYADPATLDVVPDVNCISGWLMTKIIDPTTSDSIVINYAASGTGGCSYETSFTESQTAVVGIINSLGPPQGSSSYSVIDLGDISPSGVLFPDGTTLTFTYNFQRADLLYSNGLTNVTARNYNNDIVKRFRLAYSYFTASDVTPSPAWAVSDNDYSKRLRLDSVIEVSSDSTLFKPTVFTYNSTLLNPRGSKNIDYWGYNVNPARNNLVCLPQIPLTNDPYLGLYWEGADRRPDSVYGKAAVLEKIKYPAGGFVSFDYESNKAYSEINYYEDRLVSNTPEWYETEFGQSQFLTLPNRIHTDVEFLFKTEEFYPRPPHDPEEPSACLEESQDLMTARFEITSTDNSFSTYVETTYSAFVAGGVKQVISLPLGKTYRIKFIYSTSNSCSFIYPFKAYAQGTYYVTPEDKLAGGLRIKKVTADDGAGNTLVKEYTYNNTDGRSSAEFTNVTNIPNFNYYRTSSFPDGALSPSHSLHRSSNPTNTLSFNGAPLVYTRVIEKERDGSWTERQYDPLVTGGNGGDPAEYPYLPIQDFTNHSGLMTKQLVRDNNGNLKREQTITYNKVDDYLSGDADNRNIKTGTIATGGTYIPGNGNTQEYYVADQYYMYTTRAEVVSDEVKTYENGNTLTVLQEKTYDPSTHYLSTVTTTNSKGEEREEQYLYSADGVGTAYSSMITLNMLNYVRGKLIYKPGIVNGDLSATNTNYDLFQSGSLPAPATIQSAILGNTLATDITFDAYDDKGNVLQYTAKDGVVTSFIWGYHKRYPVAKIVGKSYNDAVTGSSLNLATVNEPASDAAMRTELNKLYSLTNCMVTTLTYKPQVGATSETDVNGRTMYYEYDNFNRLTLVRDKDNNILKKICYNYTGQPVDCGYGTAAAWQMMSSVCEKSSGNNTGNLIVTEKDMNPASATYNQTRMVTVANAGACPTCSMICTGEGKKCINGACATGIKVYTAAVFTSGHWVGTYHYLWMEDCSVSADYQDISDRQPLMLEVTCP